MDSDNTRNNRSKRTCSEIVAEHYNARPDRKRVVRLHSKIYILRKFNNCIKLHLLKDACRMACERFGKDCKVVSLDIGGGKGGDIHKWNSCMIRHLVLVDIAEFSVLDAIRRYNYELEYRRGLSYSATFISADFCTERLSELLETEPSLLFHVVSCQFALHYSFETEKRAVQFFENVTCRLLPGGIFVCTIPDSDIILSRLSDSCDSLSFGNRLYRVEFSSRPDCQTPKKNPEFGIDYKFYLNDAVDGVTEFLVRQDVLDRLANEKGLELIQSFNFHDFYEKHKMDHPLSSLALDTQTAQWEISGIYKAVVYRKKGQSPLPPSEPPLLPPIRPIPSSQIKK